MRSRICLAIISTRCDGGEIIIRESKQQIELGKRRAQFEINRKKCTIKKDTSLLLFGIGFANAILEYKKTKKK